MNARGLSTLIIIALASISGCASAPPSNKGDASVAASAGDADAELRRWMKSCENDPDPEIRRMGRSPALDASVGVTIDRFGLVSIHARDVDVRAIALELSRCGPEYVWVDPWVDERVTLDVEHVRWRDAVAAVGRATGCDLEDTDAKTR